MNSLRILFSPFGSEGDVNPVLWLAEGLAARGQQITFLMTPHYARLAESRGFEWFPVGSEEEFLKFARDPRLWQPKVGTELVVEGMLQALPRYQEAFEKLNRPFDLAVTSSLGMPAAIMAEWKNIPRLTLHMQPTCMLSTTDCPLFMEGLEWICNSPRWVKRAIFALIEWGLWDKARKPLNEYRKSLGLHPWKNFYLEGIHGSPGAALFPEWFAPAQDDWPATVRQFGFPLNPDRRALQLSSDLEKFLAAGDPPIVWTHGSANFDIAQFHNCALEASRILDHRCLLVSLESPSRRLPDGAFHVSHAVFEALFPRCAAVVHHGGIGTTAKAIGIPQLIVPRAHDQPDNARRIEHLHLGAALRYSHLNPQAAAKKLEALFDSPATRNACRIHQPNVHDFRHLDTLCDWAESLAREKVCRDDLQPL